MVNLNDVKSYRQCKEKMYEAWMCIPPDKTFIVDQFHHPEVVQMLGGRQFMKAKDREKVASVNQNAANMMTQLAYAGNAKSVGEMCEGVIIQGARGDIQSIGTYRAQTQYEAYYKGKWTSDWKEIMRVKGVTVDGERCLPWIRVRYTGQRERQQFYACFIPEAQKGVLGSAFGGDYYNHAGIPHGLGDFCVFEKVGGDPAIPPEYVDTARMHIVNGLLFAERYNTAPFRNFVVQEKPPALKKPAELF